jgi:hypothetical protein
MRTFTGKSGTKYLTFKTPRGSYHTFSEVIARDAAADCGSNQGAPRTAMGQAVQGWVDPAAALVGLWCANLGRPGAVVRPLIAALILSPILWLYIRRSRTLVQPRARFDLG